MVLLGGRRRGACVLLCVCGGPAEYIWEKSDRISYRMNLAGIINVSLVFNGVSININLGKKCPLASAVSPLSPNFLTMIRISSRSHACIPPTYLELFVPRRKLI